MANQQNQNPNQGKKQPIQNPNQRNEDKNFTGQEGQRGNVSGTGQGQKQTNVGKERRQ